MTHKGLVRKHVKGHYGEWYLVLLMSGKWAAVWWCFLDMEDEFLAIVSEDQDWFDHQITFVMPDVFAAKTEALENIVAGCEKGLSECPAMDDFYGPSLEKARRALRKSVRAETVQLPL